MYFGENVNAGSALEKRLEENRESKEEAQASQAGIHEQNAGSGSGRRSSFEVAKRESRRYKTSEPAAVRFPGNTNDINGLPKVRSLIRSEVVPSVGDQVEPGALHSIGSSLGFKVHLLLQLHDATLTS